MQRSNFFVKHSLTLSFGLLFIISLIGQAYAGLAEYNEERFDRKEAPVAMGSYLHSGHFIQATFENWESEFLQMGVFVVLTIFLREKGSSESKKMDDPEFDPKNLQPKKDSPWSVKKGGFFLAFYKNSLSIVLFLLFVFSFSVHVYGSYLDHREQDLQKGKIPDGIGEFLSSSKLWFESFQNWQSEFLSVFAIIFLSVYLRQHGSSQSKPVNAAHGETGSE